MAETIIMKQEPDAVITQTNPFGNTLLRGTFATPGGGALHLRCFLSANPELSNYTESYYHPSKGGRQNTAGEILQRKGMPWSSIMQDLPDSAIHSEMLKRNENDLLGDVFLSQSQNALFQKTEDFFKHFMFDEKGMSAANALGLNQKTLDAADRFYETVMNDPAFHEHSNNLRMFLLQRGGGPESELAL